MNQGTFTKWGKPVVDLTFLTVIWVLSLIVVNPIGNFPLDDDWSFGLTVKHLVETGDYHPTGWVSMTLVANVLWGSAFCFLSGFSFTVLRISTLAAAWLGMLGVYWLMKELRQSRFLTLLVAMSFAFNPVYYVLSNTFMTDVFFTCLAIFAGIFFLKNLKNDSKVSFVLGTAFAAAAVLSRQVGLAVPLAFAVVLILQHGWRARALLRGVVPVAFCVVVLVVFEHWLAATGRLPALYNYRNGLLVHAIDHPVKLAGVFAHSSYLGLMYLGFFLSPVLFFNFPGLGFVNKQEWLRLGYLMAALTGLAFVNGLCGKGFTMPLATNTMNRSGFGPLTLRDAYQLNTTPMLPNYFWAIVTIVSLVAAAILAGRVIAVAVDFSPKLFPFKLERDESCGLFLLLVAIIYLLPFFAIGFFDRYLVPAVPFLVAGLVVHKRQTQPRIPPERSVSCQLAGFLFLIGFFIFSVCGTRDYLEWNRARWAALNELTQKDHVQPSAIDGGFEFNGFYLYDPNYQSDAKKSVWWVEDDLYLVNFHPATNYAVFRTYPFKHWMPPYTGNIYVLKRDTPDAR